MDAMLGICEKRKDMFAIFDGLDEPKINNALQKMSGVGSEGDISRWGAIFDGRSIFFDNVYTKLNVEAVKSIEVASIITNNRASNLYWLPPAGYDYGTIPAILRGHPAFSPDVERSGGPISPGTVFRFMIFTPFSNSPRQVNLPQTLP